MLNCKLNNIKDAQNLVWFCTKFDEEIDVLYQRQVIDGKSILGVMSLIGNTVTVEILSNDEDVKSFFKKEFMNFIEQEY